MMDHPLLKTRRLQLKEYCNSVLSQTSVPNDGYIYCNGTSDEYGGCWNYTKAGTRAAISCPPLLGTQIDAYGYMDCTTNGTWWIHPDNKKPIGNYSSCDYSKFQEQTTHGDDGHLIVFIVGYSISIVFLLISLFIFFGYRQLRCGRVVIHKNLFISYLFTGIVWIVYNVLVSLNGEVIMQNPVWCRALHVLAQYSIVCNFAWMFCEGLYLHTVLLMTFSSGTKLLVLCCIVGWVVPVIPTFIYTVIRAQSESGNIDCWIHENSYQWIMYGPIIFSLVINVLFLINIVRLLVTKLRQVPEASQTKKAARATLILVPLLGIQYLLMPIRPAKNSPSEEFYLYFTSVLISLQGMFVSIMYCFCNGEVLSLVRRKWNQHRLMQGKDNKAATTYTLTEHTHHAEYGTKERNGVAAEMVPLKESTDI